MRADARRLPPRLILRWCVVVEDYVSVQFLVEHGDGTTTFAGILSMPLDEWHGEAWRALRAAAHACTEHLLRS